MMDRTTAQSEPEIDYRRLRLRDNEEVVRWFDTYSDPVYGFIFYRVGRDADLAGDVAQETFVTALETIDRFDPRRGEMFSWLTHIAAIIRKSLRRKGRMRSARLLNTVDHQLPNDNRPELSFYPSNYWSRRTAELVRMALTNLPLRYQVTCAGAILRT
jgi:RNA polymerase sigma factor (sigma-70 family)